MVSIIHSPIPYYSKKQTAVQGKGAREGCTSNQQSRKEVLRVLLNNPVVKAGYIEGCRVTTVRAAFHVSPTHGLQAAMMPPSTSS